MVTFYVAGQLVYYHAGAYHPDILKPHLWKDDNRIYATKNFFFYPNPFFGILGCHAYF